MIFQDFARYQLKVGENVGVGDVTHFEDEQRWREAADLSTATPFVETLPKGFQTQLGKWFKDGRELSGGQWQKIALARAFMRGARISGARRADRRDGCTRRAGGVRSSPGAAGSRMGS